MARTYEIAFQIGAQIAGSFGKSMGSAGKAVQELNTQIKALGSQQKALKGLTDMRQRVGETSRAYTQAHTRVTELARGMANTEKPTREMVREFERAKREASNLKNRLKDQRTELRTLERTMGTAGKSAASLRERQDALAKSAERARKAQAGLQSTMAKIDQVQSKRANLRGQMFDAVALTATVAAPIRQAVKFESAMADVNKVVDQTAQESQQMGQAIVDMSRRIPMTAEALAQIVASGGQAGIARKDLLAFADSAAQMGVAFDITAEQAGDMMAKWRTAFQLSQDQVVNLADQINYLGNTTAAAAPLISDVVTRVGGLGQLAGLNSGQVAALGASLVAVGAPSEVASTGLQNMMLAMTAGASATKKQRAAFQALGFDAEEMAKAMQEDAPAAIMDLLGAIRQLGSEEQASVLSEIFGKESIKSIGQLLNNVELLEENFSKVGDATKYAGSMQAEFEARAATTENNLQLLGNRVAALGISLGNVLLPGVNALVGAIGPVIDMVADFANRFPGLTTALVGGAAALASLRVATIALGYAWTFIQGGALQLIKVLQLMRVAWLLNSGAIAASSTTSKAAIIMSKALAAAQWLVNAAMTANPIGLLIAAIAALVAAGYFLIKNWDTVKAWFLNFKPVQWVMGGIQKLWSWFTSLDWGSLGMNAINLLRTAFLKFTPMGWMLQGINKAWQYLKSIDWSEAGKSILQTLINGIKSMAMAPVEAVKNAFGKLRDLLPFSDAKVGPLSELTASGAAIMDTLAQGVNSAQPLSAAVEPRLGDALAPVAARSSAAPGSAGGGGITLHYSPTINVDGAAGDVRQQAEQGARAGADDLVDRLRAVQARERRLSYG